MPRDALIQVQILSSERNIHTLACHLDDLADLGTRTLEPCKAVDDTKPFGDLEIHNVGGVVVHDFWDAVANGALACGLG